MELSTRPCTTVAATMATHATCTVRVGPSRDHCTLRQASRTKPTPSRIEGDQAEESRAQPGVEHDVVRVREARLLPRLTVSM